MASATARRHGIAVPLLFAWRKAYREGRLGSEGSSFYPVRVDEVGRRPLFELADIERVRKKQRKGGTISPVALEAVRKIDEIFAIERDVHGLPPDQRLAERPRLCAPLVHELHTYMITEREKLSRHADVAKAMNYMLAR